MKLKTRLMLGLLSALLAAPLVAADPKKMDPAMEKAMKLGMPGNAHIALTPYVGSWTATVKFWMKPGDKVQESKGTATNTFIYGGRFLKQEFKGDMMGQPFEGQGITGYDNVREEYQSIWLDNMSTGIMKTTGSYDPSSKIISQSGTFGCPMTGKKDESVRSELKLVSNDQHVYTSYSKDPTGKEFKAMEITYSRAK